MPIIEQARRPAAVTTDSLPAILRGARQTALLPLFGKLLKAFALRVPMNDSARRVLTLPYAEQLLYVERLIAFNVGLRASDDDREVVYDHAGRFGFVARFNQLPCTPQTRRDRADLLERAGLKDAPVVLLGDDDLVAVELSARGFSDVTVADCDEALLGVIASMTAGNARRPRLELADFGKGFKASRPAAAVCLDPPYNPSAVKLFLEVALANVDPAEPHTLYLMYNPYLVGAVGRLEVERVLEAAGYSQKKRLEAFNSYRVNRAQGLLIRLCGRVLFGARGRIPRGRGIHYFSDCFVYEPKAKAKR